MVADVTVVIPHIPTRKNELGTALLSVIAQTVQPYDVRIVTDAIGDGAAVTRNRGLYASQTRWTAFLDDDDELYPQHLEVLLKGAEMYEADLVYPWFDCDAGDPLGVMGQVFCPATLRTANYIPVTTLVNTALLQAVGGFHTTEQYPHEDWAAWVAMLDAGARVHHVAECTWKWNRGPQSTGGRRWTDT